MNRMPLFENRRRSPRYDVSVPATAVVHGPAETPPFELLNVSVRNVSREGLMLMSEGEDLPAGVALSDILGRGRSCKVSWRIPGSGREATVQAVVRWAACHQGPNRMEYRIGASLDDSGLAQAQPFFGLLDALEAGELESS